MPLPHRASENLPDITRQQSRRHGARVRAPGRLKWWPARPARQLPGTNTASGCTHRPRQPGRRPGRIFRIPRRSRRPTCPAQRAARAGRCGNATRLSYRVKIRVFRLVLRRLVSPSPQPRHCEERSGSNPASARTVARDGLLHSVPYWQIQPLSLRGRSDVAIPASALLVARDWIASRRCARG